MSRLTKNLTALGALVLLIAGAGVTILGIFKAGEVHDKTLGDEYIIPSQIFNALTVTFLLYLTANNVSFSPSYKLLIIILLVSGLVLEIYLTSYSDRDPESIAAYVFIVLNFLIRTFFLIDLSQGEWASPITQQVAPMQKAIKQTITDIVTPAPAPASSSSDSLVADYKEQWRSILKDVKAKNPDVDGSTVGNAWRVIDEAVKNEEFTKAYLKEALSKLKNKDGSDVVGVSVGGKRRS